MINRSVGAQCGLCIPFELMYSLYVLVPECRKKCAFYTLKEVVTHCGNTI